jgi:hypothetical protein
MAVVLRQTPSYRTRPKVARGAKQSTEAKEAT